MELTSGEMLYRANEMGSIGRKLYSDITEEFWQFLDASKSVSSNGDEMVHSNKSISASVEAYILKLRHRILTVRKAVEYTKYGVINEMNYENKKFTSALLDLQKRFDSEALQLVLQYYAIIQQEIETSRVKLVQENTEKELLFKQAAVLRDIRLFASHLMVESRGKLGFTMLPAESQQFARCVKAVMDNVQDEAFSTGDVARFRSRIKVLNVFKLQNSFLSGKLQAASERVNNGKIKGLFVCLPQEQFYSFSVFGLHAQVVPYKPTINLQQLSGEIFSTAWFHAEPPAGIAVSIRQNTEVAHALKVAGTAAKLAVQRSARLSGGGGSDTGAAGSKPSRSTPHIYRFSRYSTISNLRDLSREALEGGVFLALCRVLVVQQHTISTTIEDADIMAGLQQGCDCVYSSATEEYVLLQPKFVLPEFFMHVQFPADDILSERSADAKGGAHGGAISAGSTLPPMLSVDPGTTLRSPARRKPQLSPTKNTASAPFQDSACDGVFPVENVLLQNAVSSAERESGCSSGHITYEKRQKQAAASGTYNDDEEVNLHATLYRKQQIVEGLQRAVQSFQLEKDALLVECARNLAKKVP